MPSYEEFKESKITDLVYRFFFGFFIAIFILLCESIFNGIGDAYIEKVTIYFSSHGKRRFVIGIGLILGAVAIAFKNVELFVNETPEFSQFTCLNIFVKELASFFVKISSDLLLIAYAMLSFLFGIVVFMYCYFYDEFPGYIVMQALPAYFSLMAVLATISILIRSTNEDWFYSKFWVLPILKRLVIYSLVILGGLYFIWQAATT